MHKRWRVVAEEQAGFLGEIICYLRQRLTNVRHKFLMEQ